MVNRSNINARMVRNANYTLFIFETSILRREKDILSAGPGFVVIAVMETGTDI
jgi:hypothetical protein